MQERLKIHFGLFAKKKNYWKKCWVSSAPIAPAWLLPWPADLAKELRGLTDAESDHDQTSGMNTQKRVHCMLAAVLQVIGRVTLVTIFSARLFIYSAADQFLHVLTT